MIIADLKDYWGLVASIGAAFVALVGFLWKAFNNISKAKNTLDNLEKQLNTHTENFKNIESAYTKKIKEVHSNVRNISFYLNELWHKIEKLMPSGDKAAMSARLKELLDTTLLSANPVTPEERERFEKYRQKAMYGQPFATTEYEEFKSLGEKFRDELPPDKQAEFEGLMTGLLSSLLSTSIRRFESDQRIADKEMEVQELPWGKPVSGHLERAGDARFYVLKGVKAHGEVKVHIEVAETARVTVVAKYELLPKLHEWEYQAQGEGAEKALTIFPTKPGDYYLVAAAETAGGNYTITASEVGYYYLKTTSFLQPDKQEEFQRKAKTTHPVYNIHAIVDTDIAEGLDRIERVEYNLPGSWPAELREQVKTDREKKFLLKELAYGYFVLTAKVYLRDGKGPLELQEFVKLQEAGPHLI